MVNNCGHWTEEKDYSSYPKEKWCDVDRMANMIREKGYSPKNISMEELIIRILCDYEESEEVQQHGYYAFEKIGNELDVRDVFEFVKDDGGFEEFDWEA